MFLPFVNTAPRRYRRQLLRLGGLDRRQSAPEGALVDSQGLWVEDLPSLSQRSGRQRLRDLEGGTGLYAWDKLCTVENGVLCWDGQAVGELTPGAKQMAVVNTKLCVFPDKKYLDLTTGELDDLEARVVNRTTVSFATDAVTFFQDQGTGVLDKLFSPGDRVVLSNCTRTANNTPQNEPLIIQEITGGTVRFQIPEGSQWALTPGLDTAPVTLTRPVPELDYICQSDNRLFGVNNAQGIIYASALGDPKNFYVYDGLSTDSYAVSVGTDGDFTGCVAYGGSVLFWKEDCVHKLLGDYPADYQLCTYQIAGVEKGSAGSMAVLNEVLYYKGIGGVYAYSGSLPRIISAPLGSVEYEKAVGGVDTRRYYLSMRRRDTGVWELLSYDTRTGLWMKEEDREVTAFANLNGQAYMLSDNALYLLGQGRDDQGTPIPWRATFAPVTETTHRRKYPSRLLLRLELEPGAWAEAWLARDGGAFENVWSAKAGDGPTAVAPIRPGRCDRYQIELRGEGRCVLQSLEREFTLGGDGA